MCEPHNEHKRWMLQPWHPSFATRQVDPYWPLGKKGRFKVLSRFTLLAFCLSSVTKTCLVYGKRDVKPFWTNCSSFYLSYPTEDRTFCLRRSNMNMNSVQFNPQLNLNWQKCIQFPGNGSCLQGLINPLILTFRNVLRKSIQLPVNTAKYRN